MQMTKGLAKILELLAGFGTDFEGFAASWNEVSSQPSSSNLHTSPPPTPKLVSDALILDESMIGRMAIERGDGEDAS